MPAAAQQSAAVTPGHAVFRKPIKVHFCLTMSSRDLYNAKMP